MTSLEIAEFTGKTHAHVMRDIRNCESDYLEVYGGESKFGLSSYNTSQGKEMPMYELNKSQALFLASGYNPIIRAKIQKRWEDLEINQLPQTYADALRQLAETVEQNEKTSKMLELANDKIEADKPKVVFAESVTGSSNSILVRQFAKDLCDDGFDISQNRLFTWFRKNGYLNSQNEPYQNYLSQGLFEVVTRSIGSGDETFTAKTTKITGKGQLYFANKIKNNNTTSHDYKIL